MAEATAPPKSDGPFLLSLDVGTSSVRTLLFDGSARQVAGFGLQLPYRVETTADGGVEIDGDELFRLTLNCLSAIHGQLHEQNICPSAVAFSGFWHSFLGISSDERPTTPLVHLFDTRAATAAAELARRVDPVRNHSRTGCVLHASYWPAKLLWLSRARPVEFSRTTRWIGFGEYLFLKLFGIGSTSTSMVSGSGLWNQNACHYDEEILSVLPISKAELVREEQIDTAPTSLQSDFRSNLYLLDGIPWFPVLGDGACNNVGSGCIEPSRFTLMVGTSGAMRAVFESDHVEIPSGLWCYRVDRKRFVLGGALSNGGEVFAWMNRTLKLPDSEEEIEQSLQQSLPGAHGLTVLPLFAGERSPKWRAHARAAISGMSLHTQPIDLLQASLESVALRFREIYELMSARLGDPREIIASGNALRKSQAWTQMMADALSRPVRLCLDNESSSRGAALLALERLGAIQHIRDLPATIDEPRAPRLEFRAAYDKLLEEQRTLYRKLLEDN